jgi:hypothetical protein
MLIIKMIVVIVSGICDAIGGATQHNFRRFIMPVVICAGCAWLSHSWYAFLGLASIGALCLGYGPNSPLEKDTTDSWARELWGCFVAFSFGLPLLLTGHLAGYWFLGYILVCGSAENALKKLWQVAGDFIVGCCFASIILLVH